MRQPLHVFLLVLLFIKCNRSQHREEFYKLLNNNFINLVGTTPYDYGVFFIAPRDSLRKKYVAELPIALDTVIHDSKDLQQALEALLPKHLLKFRYLLKPGNSLELNTIDIEDITNTGRYKLIARNDNRDIEKAIGSISFYQPVLKDNKAIIFMSIHAGPKARYRSAYLLEKVNGEWKFMEKVDLDIF
jgi:hypothetical protein